MKFSWLSRIPLLVVTLILSIVTLLSIGLDWYHSQSHVNDLLQDSVEDKALISTNQLKVLMELYTQTLYGARGLMSIQAPVSRRDWQTYYQNLGVTKRLPGLRSLAYLPVVPAGQKEAFTAEVRADQSINPGGYPTFSIHPPTDNPEAVVITYLEPSNLTSLQQTFGFDILSESTRKAALEKTRDTNQPVLSEPTKSLSSDLTSFVMMLPVYAQDREVLSPTERRQSFKGAVNLVFRTQELFDQVFIDYVNSDTQVEVFDGENTDPERLLYDSQHQQKVLGASDPSDKVVVITSTQVADRTWTLRFTRQKTLERYFILPSLGSRLLFLLLTNIVTATILIMVFKSKSAKPLMA